MLKISNQSRSSGWSGRRLDRGEGPERWNRWRPTVDLRRHDDLLVSALRAAARPPRSRARRQVIDDIRSVSPETESHHAVDFGDPWDFGLVYGALHDFARGATRSTPRTRTTSSTSRPGPTSRRSACSCSPRRATSRRGCCRPRRRASTRRHPARSHDHRSRPVEATTGWRPRFEQQQREDLSFLKSGIDTRNARSTT